MRYLLLILPIFLISQIQVLAQGNDTIRPIDPYAEFSDGDEIPYDLLSPKDTLFLKIGVMQNKYLVHKVQKGHTLFAIARFYKIAISDVTHFNSNANSLGIDQTLDIPITSRSIILKKTRPL